ncbi:MAG TPA: uroporphyrinogen-III C-methyltransferase, partial [Caulobacteraceae bacterium]|nr:uroporphyrinogen-III C-methyltransferase [Caulobacteraceae bacterium]
MARSSSRERAQGLVLLRGGEGRGGKTWGKVWLVGAGPGDPELLTLKAARLIAAADVVVHDALVSEEILALVPESARRISVAKRKSRHSHAQGEIDRLLIALAREGLKVVRLKGGDPFVFGRGAEEVAACRAAGIACEVVPGITAALAAAAGALAPLTARGAAQAVSFVTGHSESGGLPALDWTALAQPNATLVVYMGRTVAGDIARRLIGAGRAASTPALIVENASLAAERRIATTLAGLGEAAAGLTGPALLMIGEAMAAASVAPAPLPASRGLPPEGGESACASPPPQGEGDRSPP